MRGILDTTFVAYDIQWQVTHRLGRNTQTNEKRTMTHTERHNAINTFVSREVFCNCTAEVEYILRQEDPGAPFSWDDLERGLPTGTMSLDECREYLSGYYHDDDMPVPNPYAMTEEEIETLMEDEELGWGVLPHETLTLDEKREYLVDLIDEEELDGLDEWREAVLECESENLPEIYEWWNVSSWLAEHLRQRGECIIEGFVPKWGRQATGQAIALDYVIGEIYDAIHSS